MYSRNFRLLALAAIIFPMESPAFAYLDAATGSIIIQAIVGAVGTWIVYSKLFLSRTKGFFAGLLGKKSDASADE